MKKILLFGIISFLNFSFSSFAAITKENNESEERSTIDINNNNSQKPSDGCQAVEPCITDATSSHKFTIELRLDFSAGMRNQNHLTSYEKFLSHENKHFAFDSEAGIKFTYINELENFSYGAVAVLTPTAQLATSSAFNGTYIFFSTEHGIVKLGSPNDAGGDLRITGGDKAVSGSWKNFILLNPIHVVYRDLAPEFEKGNSYYMASYKTKLSLLTDGTEFARKISFLTPEVTEGFRFGISYTPDSRNTGSTNFSRNAKSESGIKKYKISPTQTWRINSNVINGVAAGISYRHIFDETTITEIAVTGEFAKASGTARLIQNKGETIISDTRYKLTNLKTYNIGGNLYVGNFCYGLSFGTLNNSLTTPLFHKTGRNTTYYNGSITYTQGPIKTSIEYFKSNKYKNILDVITLGTEYKVAPGLTPYAEFSYLTASGRPSYYPEASKKKFKASTFVTGLKLRIKL